MFNLYSFRDLNLLIHFEVIILTTTPSKKGNKEGESQPNYNDLTILNQLYLNSKLIESDEVVNNFRIFFSPMYSGLLWCQPMSERRKL